MYSISLKSEISRPAPVIPITHSTYYVNEQFLKRLGFERNDVLSDHDEAVYRYYNPFSSVTNGIEIHYLKLYSILSVEEFWLNGQQDDTYISRTIVGEFIISSDNDIEFIFQKNVRLHYIFQVANKRI